MSTQLFETTAAFQTQANQSPQDLAKLSIQVALPQFYLRLPNSLNNHHTTYQTQQSSSHPAALDRLLTCYNIGIRAAIQQDTSLATEVIDVLERSINPHSDMNIALSLRGIYDECRQLIQTEDWAHYAENLERLKGLWIAKHRVQQATI